MTSHKNIFYVLIRFCVDPAPQSKDDAILFNPMKVQTTKLGEIYGI